MSLSPREQTPQRLSRISTFPAVALQVMLIVLAMTRLSNGAHKDAQLIWNVHLVTLLLDLAKFGHQIGIFPQFPIRIGVRNSNLDGPELQSSSHFPCEKPYCSSINRNFSSLAGNILFLREKNFHLRKETKIFGKEVGL